MSLYKGTSIEQDGRFASKDKKLLSKLEYPPEYATKIKKDSVNIKVIQTWIDKKLVDILGFEDECISNFIINLIEESEEYIDPKKIQYNITGFLDTNTYKFMQDFWKLLISAQSTTDGIPDELIKEKKEELLISIQKRKERIKFLDDYFAEINNKNNNEPDIIIYEKKHKKHHSRSRSKRHHHRHHHHSHKSSNIK